jgi:hypothetical protein
MVLVLILFLLAVMVLSLIGYASFISGAQASNRWRRLFVVLTFLMVAACCLVFALAGLVGLPVVGRFLTWPLSDPLIGEWQCVEANQDCAQPLEIEVGDGSWTLYATLTFAKEGRLTAGNRSLLLRNGVVTSGGATCEYDVVNTHRLRLDCGYGTQDFDYQLAGDRLTITTEPTDDLPSVSRVYQRANP